MELREEKEHLRSVFKVNGYPDGFVSLGYGMLDSKSEVNTQTEDIQKIHTTVPYVRCWSE